MFPHRARRPLRGPQAVLAIMVLALAYWGSVAWLVGLRTEVTADPDFLFLPEEEAEEVPAEPSDEGPFRQPLEPARTSYPRVLGLAFGNPPMILTNRPALHLCDLHDDPVAGLHLIRPQREEP